MLPILRHILLPAAVALLAAGCSLESVVRPFVDERDDAFARQTIERIRTGDTASVARTLAPHLIRLAGVRDSIAALRPQVGSGAPGRAELVGLSTQHWPAQGLSVRRLSYLTPHGQDWAMVAVEVVADDQGYRYLGGVQVQPVAGGFVSGIRGAVLLVAALFGVAAAVGVAVWLVFFKRRPGTPIIR